MLLGNWEKIEKFSVKSIYNALTSNEAGSYYKQIWKEIAAKIKIFMWLVSNVAILTKENLQRRK